MNTSRCVNSASRLSSYIRKRCRVLWTISKTKKGAALEAPIVKRRSRHRLMKVPGIKPNQRIRITTMGHNKNSWE